MQEVHRTQQYENKTHKLIKTWASTTVIGTSPDGIQMINSHDLFSRLIFSYSRAHKLRSDETF